MKPMPLSLSVAVVLLSMIAVSARDVQADVIVVATPSVDNGGVVTNAIPAGAGGPTTGNTGTILSQPFFINSDHAFDSTHNSEVQLATDNAGVWVAIWETPGISVSRSVDNGVTWSDPDDISGPGGDKDPSIATDKTGTWMIVWDSTNSLGGALGPDSDILFVVSIDNGATWSLPAAVNSTALDDHTLSTFDEDEVPVVVTDDNGVWVVVWESDYPLTPAVDDDKDIFFARSINNGTTWSGVAALNSSAASDGVKDDEAPHIATDTLGTWIAVWSSRYDLSGDSGTDLDLFYSVSDDGGMSWSDVAYLNSEANDDGFDNDRDPRIATDRQGAWVVTWEFDSVIVNSSRSIDGGASWSPSERAISSASDPDIATDRNGNWIVVAPFAVIGLSPVAMKGARSVDNGLSWTPSDKLDILDPDNDWLDSRPSVETDGSGTWIVAWDSPDDLPGNTDGGDRDIVAVTLDLVCDDIYDVDSDNFSPCEGDCKDDNDGFFPGAPEICDALDTDCDGLSDVDDPDLDQDMDGVSVCNGDDDTDPNIQPGLRDCVDGVDNDGDGDIDEGTGSISGFIFFGTSPTVPITKADITIEWNELDGNTYTHTVQPDNNGMYSIDCLDPRLTHFLTAKLTWTDFIRHPPIGGGPDTMDEERSTERRTFFFLDLNDPHEELAPFVFPPPVVFVHGADAGSCVERAGVTCGQNRCSRYLENWTDAFEAYRLDGYVPFVADGLIPCNSPLQLRCSDGSPCECDDSDTCADGPLPCCTDLSICGDGFACALRCPNGVLCAEGSNCGNGVTCERRRPNLHERNAVQLNAALSHVDTVLQTYITDMPVKVDIVAHSMGGLTTRALLGNADTLASGTMINQVAMLGTPNAGSVNAEASSVKYLGGEINDRRPDAKYLTRRQLWYFNRKYDTSPVPLIYVAGSGGPTSEGLYAVLTVAEPNPNDGIVSEQSVFDFAVSDAGTGIHGNERFRDHGNCQAPPDATSTHNCLMRVSGAAYLCTDDDHTQLRTSTDTIDEIQTLLEGRTLIQPLYDCLTPPTDTMSLGLGIDADEPPRMTRLSAGTLLANTSTTESHLIDASSESLFSLQWNTGTLTFTLEDPLGVDISPTVASNDPNIEYFDGTGNPQGPIRGYIIQNPMSGNWTLRMSADADVDQSGEGYLAGTTSLFPIDVGASFSQNPANVGDTVILSVVMVENGTTTLTGGSISGTVVDRLGATTNVSCMDDGLLPDIVAGDGTFNCSYGPIDRSGLHSIEFIATGNRSDGVPFERTDVFQLSVNSPDASILGNFTEQPVDENNNGLWDTLRINVDVDVLVDGIFSLEGDLERFGVVVDRQVLEPQALSSGTMTLTLNFSGIDIRRTQLDGPYTLTNLTLRQTDADQMVTGSATVDHTSAKYKWTEFEIDDADGDGIDADSDNCPFTSNVDQSDTDADGIGDSCDNCPGFANAPQVDGDGDGSGDECDLCPSTADAVQSDVDGDLLGDNCDTDADADGIPNASDCSTLDNSIWSFPPDITDVNFTDKDTLSWSPQTVPDGSAVLYDVAKGLLAALRSTGEFSDAICLLAHDPATSVTDSVFLIPGETYYYLVRSRSGCGPADYGQASGGTRTLGACP